MKKSDNTGVPNVEQKELSYNSGHNHFGNNLALLSDTGARTLQSQQLTPAPSPGEAAVRVSQNRCVKVHSSVAVITEDRKRPRCPSIIKWKNKF